MLATDRPQTGTEPAAAACNACAGAAARRVCGAAWGRQGRLPAGAHRCARCRRRCWGPAGCRPSRRPWSRCPASWSRPPGSPRRRPRSARAARAPSAGAARARGRSARARVVRERLAQESAPPQIRRPRAAPCAWARTPRGPAARAAAARRPAALCTQRGRAANNMHAAYAYMLCAAGLGQRQRTMWFLSSVLMYAAVALTHALTMEPGWMLAWISTLSLPAPPDPQLRRLIKAPSTPFKLSHAS